MATNLSEFAGVLTFGGNWATTVQLSVITEITTLMSPKNSLETFLRFSAWRSYTIPVELEISLMVFKVSSSSSVFLDMESF